MRKNMPSASRSRRGAMLVLIAVVFVILLIGAVFSIDVAYMHMIRAELRAATDAAARAGSEALARTQDPEAARTAAMAIAEQNLVAGNGLTLHPSDIQFGSISPTPSGKFAFQAGGNPLTAVQILGRRENGSADGPVGLFFARVFSTNHFEPTERATAAASVRDVALVLDVSGSMSAASGAGTRLSALKEAVNTFLDEVAASSPATRISLTSYSSAPEKLIDLTSNFASIRSEVNAFEADGMTAIGNGLLVGSDSLVYDSLARPYAAKTVIVMTDGNHNTGPSPSETVSTAVSRNQQVHTITFSSEANESLMQEVAAATVGGIHIHADEAADLNSAFREIARALAVVLIE